MSIDPTDLRIGAGAQGAVPLGQPQTPATGGGGYVIDVDEATFQADVIERSRTVPVVIDFWAEWCGPCKQLSPLLERLAKEGAGSWLLAKVDSDANPRLAQAFGIQSIPSVKAVVGGQLVELFTGALPEAQVRQVIDQVRSLAAQMGVVGRIDPIPAAAPDGATDGAAPTPAYEIEAQDAIERGDLVSAAAAYERALADKPSDDFARQGLAQVRFLQRLEQVDDPGHARQRAAERPDDVDAQLLAADIDVYAGEVAEGFARLVDLVRRTAGDERDRVRMHLLELFDVVGGDDPRVGKARRALTSALF